MWIKTSFNTISKNIEAPIEGTDLKEEHHLLYRLYKTKSTLLRVIGRVFKNHVLPYLT